MAKTTLFWTEIDHFSIWSLQFPNFAYKPLIFSISNFKPLKIRLKGKWVKIQVITKLLDHKLNLVLLYIFKFCHGELGGLLGPKS
jgi:hypothetical protein